MNVFERTAGQALTSLVATSLNSADEKHRFVGRNVEWDSRVGPIRQARLESILASAPLEKRSNLRDALRYYKRRSVTVQQSCAFDRKLNGNNATDRGELYLRRARELGTVINLSWRIDAFLHAKASASPGVFADFPANALDEDRWFDERFYEATAAKQDQFLDEAFAALFAYSKAPVWAAEWTRLAACLPKDANEWLHTVGCFPGENRRELAIVLAYSEQDVPPLFRPTQLDSGDNYLHFPVPGSTEAAIGGFVLNLCPQLNAYETSREWIHAPSRFTVDNFNRANRVAGWTKPLAVGKKFVSQRRTKHASYLRGHVEGLHGWMENPN